MNIQLVILSGGSGTRMWPLSREQYPKQLLTLVGDTTMLQATGLRIDASVVPQGGALKRPLIVSNDEYRFITAEQMREVGMTPEAIILEPEGRNTAPALTLAALSAGLDGDDPVLVVMPADHVIGDLAAFRAALAEAARLAATGRVVTCGIVPTGPETGYGYIQQGPRLSAETASTPDTAARSADPSTDRSMDQSASGASSIARFVEKPDLATAQSYIASGEYLWNSGIFVLRASVWLDQLGRFRPEILAACAKAIEGRQRDADFLRPAREAFLACPSDSIDYAVMENMVAEAPELGVVLPLTAGWSDVGAWNALLDVGNKDADGNVVHGDTIVIDTRDTLVRAESRLVACLGLDDIIVVETPDAVLVAHRDRVQDVKKVVARLKAAGRPECDAHRKIHRPWGWYDSIDNGERFQVKRIVVNPGAQLSLQMHHHRAEHWVVVTGTARVTRGEDVFLLSENQSTYLPIGTRHRLENPGKLPLEMIEVQSGSYLGEDDIVRFQDNYGRS
jgi:mannose-1-phosphate guanylyltransferase/mannose-6-phosphate isomerase